MKHNIAAPLALGLVLAGCTPMPPTPPPASYIAENYMTVRPVADAPEQFEVFSLPGAGPSQFWCAAGEYVMRALHRGAGTRIYLETALGNSQMQPASRSIRFTLAPGEALVAAGRTKPQGDYSLSLIRAGDNWRAGHVAMSSCERIIMTPMGE